MLWQLSGPWQSLAGNGSLIGDGLAFKLEKNLGKTESISVSDNGTTESQWSTRGMWHRILCIAWILALKNAKGLSPLSGHAPQRVGRSNTTMWNFPRDFCAQRREQKSDHIIMNGSESFFPDGSPGPTSRCRSSKAHDNWSLGTWRLCAHTDTHTHTSSPSREEGWIISVWKSNRTKAGTWQSIILKELKALAPDVKKVQPPAEQDSWWNPLVAKDSDSLKKHSACAKITKTLSCAPAQGLVFESSS